MKNRLSAILLLVLIALSISACKKEDNPLEAVIPSTITAKSQVTTVMTKAKADFAADAKLAGIYGFGVAKDGTINLLQPTSNLFVYVVQSTSKNSNEFYVPVYAAGPIKSPINFTSMLGVIADSAAKSTIGGAFGLLSSITISDQAQFTDSPTALNLALQNGGNTFITNNGGNASMYMYLLPSKTLSINGLIDSADWVVNFSANGKSLVLWINSGTNIVVKISG